MTYTLPTLNYAYDALASAISADIMELHHSKHHQTYVDKLNAALESVEDAPGSLEALLTSLEHLPSDVREDIRNNGGGHYNHSLFWQCMSPQGGGEPTGELKSALEAKYGSFEKFVEIFSDEATKLFGSGWVWLQPDVSIVTTANQDNPLMEGGEAPLLGLDVWEHAYYLDYRNVRPDYIKAWWGVVDWGFVASRYSA